MNDLIARLPLKANDYSVPFEILNKDTVEGMEWDKVCEIRLKNNKCWTKDYYERIGIEVLSEDDDLFFNVKLPNGWKIRHTEQGIWKEVLDEKNRERMSFFYKNTPWDRDAFINFQRRLGVSSKISDYDEELFEIKPEFIAQGTKTIWVNEDDEEVKAPYLTKEDSNDDVYYEYTSFEDGEVEYTSHDGDYFKRRTLRAVEVPNYIPNPDYVKLTGYEKYSQPFHYEVHDYDKKVLFKSDVVRTSFEYSSNIHTEFFHHLRKIEEKARKQCIDWLTENYPNYRDINAYWD